MQNSSVYPDHLSVLSVLLHALLCSFTTTFLKTAVYSWVERDCEGKVSCPRTQQNDPGQATMTRPIFKGKSLQELFAQASLYFKSNGIEWTYFIDESFNAFLPRSES